jgi:prepilin-type N-terminal cleavage/methylation domain-containing protein
MTGRPRSISAARLSRRGAGFTLTELLIVVALIGILAAVAIPSFTKFAIKARRAEALMALRQLFELQTTYYSNRNEYSDSFEEVGFAIYGGTLLGDGSYEGPYYSYTLQTWSMLGVPNANFRGTATGDIDPSDPILDIVIIENQLTIN